MSRQKMKQDMLRMNENNGEQKRAAVRDAVQRPFLSGLTELTIFSWSLLFFLHPAEKDAKNHLTNCYGGGII
mgnify:CR=1 FL=1